MATGSAHAWAGAAATRIVALPQASPDSRLDGVDVGEAAGWGDPVLRPLPDAVLLELEGLDDDALAPLLDGAAVHAEALGPRLIAAFAPEHVDLVAGALLGSGAQLLSAPAPAERAAALAIARGAPTRVGEPSAEEAARLAALADEVARVANALARLSRGEPAERTPARAGFAAEAEGDAPDPARVRGAIRARRSRDAEFGPGLFEEPAWDMLLDLFAAELEGGRVSVSSLCIAAAVAQTTALRWIGRMAAAGLLERREDPADRRRAFITLSERASGGMCRWFAAVERAGLTT